jgi:hypothetical protein
MCPHTYCWLAKSQEINMRKLVSWMAFFWISSGSIVAQPVVRQLTSETRVSVRGEKAVVLGPQLQCDNHGDIFVLSVNAQTIEKISPDGQNATRYPSPLPDKPDSMAIDLEVTKSGGLYVLILDVVRPTKHPVKGEPPAIPKGHIVRYTTDGTRDSDVVLDLSYFLPSKFVVTENSFIVLGTFIDPKTLGAGNEAPLRTENGVVLFDLNGQFLRKLSETPQPRRGSPMAAQTATMVEGSDGNVYVKPPGSSENLSINVVSAAGSLLKTLKIVPPAGEWYVDDMKEAGGRLAILYQKQTALPDGTPTLLFRVQVVRAENGEEIAQYEATNLGMAFACYRGDTFTFLNIGKDQELQIVQARAQ